MSEQSITTAAMEALQSGHPRQAITLISKLVFLNAELPPSVRLCLAESYMACADLSSAITHYRILLAAIAPLSSSFVSSRLARAIYVVALAARDQGDQHRSLRLLREVVDMAVVHYSQAAALQLVYNCIHTNTDIPSTINRLATIALAVSSPDLHILTARLHLHRDDILASYHALERARAIAPHHPLIAPLSDKLTAYVVGLRVEVNTQAFIGRYQVALSFVLLALGLSPGNIKLLFKKAELLAALGRYSESIDQLIELQQSTLQSNQSIPQLPKLMAAVQSNHAVVLLRNNDLKNALVHINTALQYDSIPVIYHYNRAEILYKLECYDDSIRDFEYCRKSINSLLHEEKIIKRLTHMYNDQATAAYLMQKPQVALNLYSKSIEYTSTSPQTFFLRAKCYLQLGDFSKSMADLERTLILSNNQHADARMLYAQLLAQTTVTSNSQNLLPTLACSSVTVQQIPVSLPSRKPISIPVPQPRLKSKQQSPVPLLPLPLLLSLDQQPAMSSSVPLKTEVKSQKKKKKKTKLSTHSKQSTTKNS